jgi:hypothetical protein
MTTNDTKDMVYFLMPDGTKVSNDPRFDLDEANTKMLNSRENKGDMGIHFDDQAAQTQVERVIDQDPEDPTKELYGPLGSPAQQRQKEDFEKAQELGASPKETAVEDPEPVDSNEAVLKVRELRREQARKLVKAEEGLGDEGAGDPDEPYTKWSGAQLKHEIATRNVGRPEDAQLELKKGMKKAEVAKLLEQDDATYNQGSGPAPSGDGGTPDTSSQQSDS